MGKDSTDGGCIGLIAPFLKVTDTFKKCIADFSLTRLVCSRLSSLDEELEHRKDLTLSDICRLEIKF
jgi:hypothetical protein